jgi:hypothetical protein
MLRQTTRLEFIIITVAFLVMMLSSKPPQPGTAEVESPEAIDSMQVVPEHLTEMAPGTPEPTSAAEIADIPIDDEPLDFVEPAPQPAATPRVAVVDARQCEGLQFDGLMAGEITVRWVWDGQKLTPEKVCVVHEPDGSTTVWRFDQRGQAVLTEIDSADISPPD